MYLNCIRNSDTFAIYLDNLHLHLKNLQMYLDTCSEAFLYGFLLHYRIIMEDAFTISYM